MLQPLSPVTPLQAEYCPSVWRGHILCPFIRRRTHDSPLAAVNTGVRIPESLPLFLQRVRTQKWNCRTPWWFCV